MIARPVRYRTGTKRIFAALIDVLLLGVPSAFVTANFELYAEYLTVYVLPFAPIVYSLIFHYFFGQTPGKMAVGIKVWNVDEKTPITFLQALLRDSVWIVLEVLRLLSDSDYGHIFFFMNSVVFNYDLFFYWTLAELITMFTNLKRRAIHDYIAGTVVLRVEQ